MTLGGDHISEAVPVFIISPGCQCNRYFLYPSLSRERGWREAWRPTRRLLSLTDSVSSSKIFLAHTAGPSKSSLGDGLPEEPAAVCLWPLPEVLVAPRGTELTWLLLTTFYHGLNPLVVKRRRGRLVELGILSASGHCEMQHM